jgi:hypothetical protein
MKRAVFLILTVVAFSGVLFAIAGCGKNSHINKILRDDATEGSMNWLEVIKEYGVNYEWDGTTLLGAAIKAGRVDMVEALIKDKADVNRPALSLSLFGVNVGIPPLQLASSSGAADAIMLGKKAQSEQSSQIRVLLIKAGAQVKTEMFDAILGALYQVDDATFDAALPKYNKQMLDFSSYRKNEYEKGFPPFNSVHDDARFESQKPMLEKLMKKGVKFGFYDIKKALEMYMNPNLPTYGDEFLYEILAYMAKQDGINFIEEEPNNFDEQNPYYISAFDLAIHGMVIDSSNFTATDMELYIKVVKLFGEQVRQVAPYEWSIKGFNSGYPNSGTLHPFLNIIAQKIKNEQSNRDNYKQFVEGREKGLFMGQEFKPKPEPYENWTPETITEAVDTLSRYGALYHSPRNETVDDPLAYFCRKISAKNIHGAPILPEIDIIEPYFKVFDKLASTGYSASGTQSPFVYEDANDASEYFANYEEREYAKMPVWGDSDKIDYEYLKRFFSSSKNYSSGYEWILEEINDVHSGKRKGLSESAGRIISMLGLVSPLLYKK